MSICTSPPHSDKLSSSTTGIEKFEGCYFHSRDYKTPGDYIGKRIIMVGIENSGVDIAVELGQVAK